MDHQEYCPMEGDNYCWTTQLVDREGDFNLHGIQTFMTATKLADRGRSYAVVAVLGPQHGGKSTLLNHLFGTNFLEMDALRGRSKTTEGIWIAKCTGIEPFTIALDFEGTDGKERGEDDTAFEKRSALFALAIADVVIINMWCHDIGREHAANKPLLKTVFQVMMRMFGPRKITLLFVLRDKTKTPLELLEPIVRQEIQEIWDVVAQRHADKHDFSKFFNVEVVALSNYDLEEQRFREEVAQLRQQFFGSNFLQVAGDRPDSLPGSEFAFSTQTIWENIKQNKDLDLPTHRVMVETFRCEEIANEKFGLFGSDEGWLQLSKAVQACQVWGFGRKVRSILDTYLSQYDKETQHFEEGIRSARRQQLQSKVLDLVKPAYFLLLGHLRSEVLEDFKNMLERSFKWRRRRRGFDVAQTRAAQTCMLKFDKECADAVPGLVDWDTSTVRQNLQRDIERHASSVRDTKLSEMVTTIQNQLTTALSESVESLLKDGEENMWTSIRNCLGGETGRAASELSAALAFFNRGEITIDTRVQNLGDHARHLVEKMAREEAGRVLLRMQDRFAMVFLFDDNAMPRLWTENEEIDKHAINARSASLKLMSVMAAMRWSGKPDNIQDVLFSALGADVDPTLRQKGSSTIDALASSTWDEVSPEDTLLTPVECKKMWMVFKDKTEQLVSQVKLNRVKVATLRCEEIANETFGLFGSDEGWLELSKAVEAGQVSAFGRKVRSILDTYLSQYDKETEYFEEGMRSATRQQLQSKVLDLVKPAYFLLLGHLRSEVLEDFKNMLESSFKWRGRRRGFDIAQTRAAQTCMLKFDKECADAVPGLVDWDTSTVRQNLQRDIERHASSVRDTKLSEMVTTIQNQLTTALSESLKSLLEDGEENMWTSIRNCLRGETERAASELSAALAFFNLEETTIDTRVQNLRDHARHLAVKMVREEAGRVLSRMRDRFVLVFYFDDNAKRRVWAENEEIDKHSLNARSASLKLMSVMAAMRWSGKPDNIQDVLVSALGADVDPTLRQKGSSTIDALASSTWDEVSPEDTLLTPVECKKMWMVFKHKTEQLVSQVKLNRNHQNGYNRSQWRDYAAHAAAFVACAAFAVKTYQFRSQ